MSDALEAEIELYRFRIRLERVRLACVRLQDRHQMVDSKRPLDIKRPMELAGLKDRLARARFTEKAIEGTGKRYDTVLDKIDELHGAARLHVGALEGHEGDLRRIVEGMVARSNNEPDPTDGADGLELSGKGDADQVDDKTTVAEAVAEVPKTPAEVRAPDPMPPASRRD